MEKTRARIPIFLDEKDRNIAGVVPEGEADVSAWHPSNTAARKLWRCLECLRDLENLLKDASHKKNATKKKRRLKIAITPLYSLAKGLDDLLNDIHCNEETKKLLKDDEVEQIIATQKQFTSMLPHEHKSPLASARNKISSHIDRNLFPNESQILSELISPSEFGRALHICLHLILDLTKLDIYWWSCKSPSDGYICLMSNEPLLVTFKVDDKRPVAPMALHIAKRSPKNDISDVVEKLITYSRWMFKPNQPRIASLKEDANENWNTFLGDLTLSNDQK